MWKEMPFWKKALWASMLLTSIEECQKKEARSEGIGYNQKPTVRTEYRTGHSNYLDR